MSQLLKQIKARRKALGLKQSDMQLRIGISRQQYQRIESKGNPRLDILELISKGLQCELVLIPKEKLEAIKAILQDQNKEVENPLTDDPWKDILEDE